MPQLVSLQFSDRDMPLRYDPATLTDLKPSDFVVARRADREDVGLVSAVEWVSKEQIRLRGKPPEKILRRADSSEREEYFARKALERRALNMCKTKAAEMKLPMKISHAQFIAADSKIVFHFTSEQRVDFRQLVRDLSAALKTRVELWQVGVRDEAKLLDGYGLCGLRTCCSQWLPDFRPINIRMAKTQDINLPPNKLSGQCGRLLCCLSYEVDQYKEMAKELLPKGATVQIDGQDGIIIDRNIIVQKYHVRLADANRVLVVKLEDLEEVRVPDQMKKMASVFRTIARPGGEGEPEPERRSTDAPSVLGPRLDAAAPSTTEAPKQEPKGEDGEGRKGRRRSRGRRGRRKSGGEGEQPRKQQVARKDESPKRSRAQGSEPQAGKRAKPTGGNEEADGQKKRRRRRGGRRHRPKKGPSEGSSGT